MPAVTYAAGQSPVCPACGKDLEAPVEDYAIHGMFGAASAAEDCCGWCDATFRVERTPAGEYTLTPLDAGS